LGQTRIIALDPERGGGVHRFFIPWENLGPDQIQITGDDAGHIFRVLRLRRGDLVIAVSPDGCEYRAELRAVAKDRVHAGILSRQQATSEPTVCVTLVQALGKGEKMDLIVQKATELGVGRIVPMFTERCVVRLDGERTRVRLSRWQQIARSAAAQCQRALVPQVTEIHPWPAAIQVPGPKLLAWEGECAQGLKETLPHFAAVSSLAIFVGPEGGFAPRELDEALAAGLRPVSLGPRILRTETAALALLTTIMYELGDLGGPGHRANPGTV